MFYNIRVCSWNGSVMNNQCHLALKLGFFYILELLYHILWVNIVFTDLTLHSILGFHNKYCIPQTLLYLHSGVMWCSKHYITTSREHLLNFQWSLGWVSNKKCVSVLSVYNPMKLKKDCYINNYEKNNCSFTSKKQIDVFYNFKISKLTFKNSPRSLHHVTKSWLVLG